MAGVSGKSCSRQPVRTGRQASPVLVDCVERLGVALVAAEAEGAVEREIERARASLADAACDPVAAMVGKADAVPI